MNNLPEKLSQAIDEHLHSFSLADLKFAVQELQKSYREKENRQALARTGENFMSSALQKAAYLGYRLPATYAAIGEVLKEFLKQSKNTLVESFLDLGAGPGTALWAAFDAFPLLKKITLIEKDPDLIQLGEKLSKEISLPLQWVNGDITTLEFSPHDVVLFSYVLSELPTDALDKLLLKAWQAANVALIILEPGTPYGYANILLAREKLLNEGAYLLAPCPHTGKCPMAQAKDWCHFSKRVERSRLHRALKSGEKGYEDEKFSYLIASKISGEPNSARIVRHPMHHSGHVQLTLCKNEKLEQKIFSKKDKAFYKQARKLEWGDSF